MTPSSSRACDSLAWRSFGRIVGRSVASAPVSIALAAATVVSGLAAIHAEVTLARRLLYVTKPLTMLLVASMFVASPAGTGPHQRPYTWLVVAGIACSIAGDVFLMLESDRFVAGVASFLVAHVFYITAFAYGLWANGAQPSKRDIGETVGALGLYVFFVMRNLWPRLGEMRVPVGIYVVAISAMLSLAAL